MKKTIFFKIFSGYFLVIGLLSFLVLIFSFNIIRSYSFSIQEDNLIKLNKALQLKMLPFVIEDKKTELDVFIKQIGNVLADSEENPNQMENHKTRPEISEALKNKLGTSLRYSKTIKQEMLYVAFPIKQKGEIIGALRTSLFLKDINAMLINVKKTIFKISIAIIILALIGAIFFSRSLSSPIRRLRSATKKVATGDFDVLVELENNDELGDLAKNFNQMTKQIKKLFTEQSRRKEELDTIISSVQEGLIVMDKSGKIILANEGFKKIANKEHVKESFFWEAISHKQFCELIEKGRNEKKNFTEELEFNEKIFLSSVTYLPIKGDIIVIMHDVTELRKLEKIKKDLVVNVSHEMRTPLTSIKGFIETLEEADDSKKTSYIEKLKRNTDRLINIVKDLLT
ncbi:HAMP domain-containing protein, partial [Chlamydiota bacterium]